MKLKTKISQNTGTIFEKNDVSKDVSSSFKEPWLQLNG